ncbi:hypothetical protein [Arthrobacter sp. UYCo732]|uniref:hypothetical protein n=1 Tax=Arthrobacter sp. UYCo732 TaxID=3156336 RepID=UPI003398AA2E
MHRSFKFCLLTMAGRLAKEEVASFAFFLHDPAAIAVSEFELSPDEIKLINPNTGTLPIFRTRRDAEITLGIYRRVPVLINENDPVNGNPWGVSFMTMFHMSNDSHLFHTRELLEGDGWTLKGNVFERAVGGKLEKMLPLYEAKMLDRYDHRDADVVKSLTADKRQNQPRYLSDELHVDANREALPNSWIADHKMPAINVGWLTGFSDVTSATNERTILASILPLSPTGHTYPLFFGKKRHLLLALLNSIVVDFAARQKVAGLHLTYSYVKQLPILEPTVFGRECGWNTAETIEEWVSCRVLELSYTSYSVDAFAQELEDRRPPFKWNLIRRESMLAEIDAGFLHLYDVGRESAEQILDSFNTLTKNEVRSAGEYRTKRLILEAYDAMQVAIDSGIPFESILNPLPGQGPRHPAKELSA